jgi:hypothetical protein
LSLYCRLFHHGLLYLLTMKLINEPKLIISRKERLIPILHFCYNLWEISSQKASRILCFQLEGNLFSIGDKLEVEDPQTWSQMLAVNKSKSLIPLSALFPLQDFALLLKQNNICWHPAKVLLNSRYTVFILHFHQYQIVSGKKLQFTSGKCG